MNNNFKISPCRIALSSRFYSLFGTPYIMKQNVQCFIGGTGYCLGSPASDCWYLYTLNPRDQNTYRKLPDQTLEVLMTDLDPQVMKIFTQEGSSSSADATQVYNLIFSFIHNTCKHHRYLYFDIRHLEGSLIHCLAPFCVIPLLSILFCITIV